MKRLIISILVLLFLFTGCSLPSEPQRAPAENSGEGVLESEAPLFVGVWLTYAELSAKGKTEKAYREYIRNLFSSFKKEGITDVFLHVRPFADSFYNSEVFPLSAYASSDFDVLALCLEEGESFGINIHAWINPYRISLNFEGEIPYKFAFKIGKGLFFNPSDERAKSLILEGIREILENYDVAGIHFDDYFYPDNCGNFDSEAYKAYLNSGGSLSLADFRRESVNSLLLSVYSLTQERKKLFSVSPAGNIKTNYEKSYADVALWSEGGFCDMIIPQLYFGFKNEAMPFSETLDEWIELADRKKVKLAVGLALYKCGEKDEYAGTGENEWIENEDLIEKQIELIREKDLFGYCYFSASYLNKLKLR